MVRAALPVAAVAFFAQNAGAWMPPAGPWPEPPDAVDGEPVTFPSSSPYTLGDVGADETPGTEGRATLYLPRDAAPEDPVPAVVLLHGASGVVPARSPTYAGQLAGMGVAGLVVDVFGARRDMAAGFMERVLNITEAMFLADAYAALRWLDEHPAVDGDRVAVVGFSYGGMAALYSAHEQVAETFAPDGSRFVGHVAYYAPCVARFRDNRATGAPVLMLYGTEDAIVDPEACADAAAALEEGGADVEIIAYEGAYHQWDGWGGRPRQIGRSIAGCRLVVGSDGNVRDARTYLPMTSPWTRRIILGLCSDEDGYMIGADPDVRARSNAELARFLARVFSE